jgi:hypothetical protein
MPAGSTSHKIIIGWGEKIVFVFRVRQNRAWPYFQMQSSIGLRIVVIFHIGMFQKKQ